MAIITPFSLCAEPSLPHLMSSSASPNPSWQQRVAARVMDISTSQSAQLLREAKENLFARLDREEGISEVAEIGMGTGPNLEYYGKRVDHIVGVDANGAMQPYALKSAAKAGLPASSLELVVGRAEALPLADASVDAVVATLVMCEVSDVRAALAEILRILRPGGIYFFMEHVAAPQGSWLRSWQQLINPVWCFVMDGCHVNRDTLASIQAAGFSTVDVLSNGNSSKDMPWLVRPFLAHLGPTVMGLAIK